MNDHFALLKLAAANLGSWITTFFALTDLADVGAVVSIFSGLGSLSLSIFSIVWICKQSRLRDKEEKKRHAPWD